MDADRKSDDPIVPAKAANKRGTEPRAESLEGRGSAKRNVDQNVSRRTLSRDKRGLRGLFGVRESDFAFDSRQEPYEVILHVRICAGGRRQRRFLPRYVEPGAFFGSKSKIHARPPR
jgi:hypothetical protein